jgi:hypothetical protein
MVSRTSTSKSSRTPKTGDAVEARLAALEAQVATLVSRASAEQADTSARGAGDPERAPPRPSVPAAIVTPQRKFWAIDGVLRGTEAKGSESGGVVFAGQVVLPNEETYAWQIESDTPALLTSDWSVAHTPLAALAHPIRLQVLKALIEGKRDTQSLASLPNMGTTGQLYHHLKELEAAGWIRQPRRGEYIVLAERVIPLLAILSACEVTQR